MKPNSRRLGAVLTLIAGLTLVLSGCMRLHMDVQLEPDDLASGTIVMAVSDEFAAEAGLSPEDMWAQLEGLVSQDLDENTTIEPYAEDGYTGSRFITSNQPISDVSASVTGDESMTITRDGDDYVVDGSFDFTDPNNQGVDLGQSLDTMDIRISVGFPGAVSEHNGQLEGTTVTWTPRYGEVTPVHARGSAIAGGGGVPWLWIGVGAGVLVVAAIVAAVLISGRKKKSAAAAGAPYGSATAEPGQYGPGPYGPGPEATQPPEFQQPHATGEGQQPPESQQPQAQAPEGGEQPGEPGRAQEDA